MKNFIFNKCRSVGIVDFKNYSTQTNTTNCKLCIPAYEFLKRTDEQTTLPSY